jgi:hypothetical protein
MAVAVAVAVELRRPLLTLAMVPLLMPPMPLLSLPASPLLAMATVMAQLPVLLLVVSANWPLVSTRM